MHCSALLSHDCNNIECSPLHFHLGCSMNCTDCCNTAVATEYSSYSIIFHKAVRAIINQHDLILLKQRSTRKVFKAHRLCTFLLVFSTAASLFAHSTVECNQFSAVCLLRWGLISDWKPISRFSRCLQLPINRAVAGCNEVLLPGEIRLP